MTLNGAHSYVSDPQSGAGNCTCGAALYHRRHPHPFRLGTATNCVCALPYAHECHDEDR